MRTTRLTLSKYICGMVASLIIFLSGGWLILAPFALGYQPYGADWASQTTNDFVTGIAVAVVALVSFAFFFRSLLAALSAAGVLAAPTRPAEQAAVPYQAMTPGASAPQSDLDRTLATLAAALAADMAARRQVGSNQQNNQLVEPTPEGREA